jgi:hypothetical protein
VDFEDKFMRPDRDWDLKLAPRPLP